MRDHVEKRKITIKGFITLEIFLNVYVIVMLEELEWRQTLSIYSEAGGIKWEKAFIVHVK